MSILLEAIQDGWGAGQTHPDFPIRQRRTQFFYIMFVDISVVGNGESLWHACS